MNDQASYTSSGGSSNISRSSSISLRKQETLTHSCFNVRSTNNIVVLVAAVLLLLLLACSNNGQIWKNTGSGHSSRPILGAYISKRVILKF